MTMKIFKDMKKILFGLVLALTLVGCEGFLDENPPSRLTMEEAYSNSALVYLNAVAQLYSSLGIYGGYDDDWRGNSGYVYAFPHLTSDMFICPGRQGDWVDNGYYQNLFVQNYDSTYKMDKAAWSKIFNFVAKCNTSIDDLTDMLENGGDEFLKDYIAEIRALRAFVYTYALDFWGRVPILTTAKVEMSEVKQAARHEVYEFVRDELVEVIPLLADAKCQTLGQEYYARMTKYVGYAMLAKLAANAPIYVRDNWNDGELIATFEDTQPNAVYDKKYHETVLKKGRFIYHLDDVFNKVTESGKNIQIKCPDGASRNCWETVIWCEEKLKEGGYKLEANYGDNFTNSGNEKSQENIFIRPSDYSTYNNLGDSYPRFTYSYEHATAIGAGMGPNGTSATLHTLYMYEYDYETDTSPDPRFDACFYHGYVYDFSGKIIPSSVGPGYEPYARYIPEVMRLDFGVDYDGEEGKYIVRWAGARNAKYKCDPNAPKAGLYAADRVVLRYGDILLLSAEAELRLGHADKALEKVNMIRNRAGAAPFAEVTPQILIDERGRELAWEVPRRQDLVRYGLYTLPTMDKFVGVVHHAVANDYEYDNTGWRTVFPIPFTQLQLNAQYTQNVGWN